MSIREKLLQIQTEGGGLNNRFDQKHKLKGFKDQLSQSAQEGQSPNTRRLKEILVDAGIVDILIEVVDYIPFVQVSNLDIGSIEHSTRFSISLEWSEEKGELTYEHPRTALVVTIMPDNTLNVYSTHGDEVLFSNILKPEQYRDRERLESSIADTLWMAGVRPTGGYSI